MRDAAPTLRNVAPGLHVLDAPQRFMGLELGARMTVLDLGAGLLVHSPVAIPPDAIAHIGRPRWVLAPNLFHHLHVEPWIDAGLEAWGPRGLAEKRPNLRLHGLLENTSHPFGADVRVLPLTCFPWTQEILVLHRPSKTLIVTDLVFHLSSTAPWTTRTALRCLGGYPGCRSTLVERIGMRREAARKDLATLGSWDFDRLIMAHGEIIETGGKAAFANAFRWLGL